MSDPLRTSVNLRTTPQTVRADPREIVNAAGGYVYSVGTIEQVKRFLVLGSASGTYYASARNVTINATEALQQLAVTDHKTFVDTIVDISVRGAAPKANYALYALALACSLGTTEEKQYALSMLPRVARIGTHLFLFATYVKQFRGWGRGLRRAVANWYLSPDPDDLTYQAVKYRQREGWSHRDLLRKSHPATADPYQRAVFDWITHGTVGDHIPELIEGYIKANEAGADVAQVVRDYRLTWEMLPDAALSQVPVWDALLDNGVPMTALIRQLPRLTRLGMLPDMGEGRTADVVAQVTDSDRLVRARVHPFNVLVAGRTYASGQSDRGSSTWHPSRRIVDALDAAFYAAYGAVEPAGKMTLVALDVSGSMSTSVGGVPNLSAREASSALALVQVATEENCGVIGFTAGTGRSSLATHAVTPLPISPRQRLHDVTAYTRNLPFGATDCALPMLWAAERKIPVETFVIYTDNETWAGRSHPVQALRAYRETSGINSKMIVVGMTATECSIADPNDVNSLDIAGFDSGLPNLISEFSRGL